MSLDDSIFEELGSFAITVQRLVQTGWSFNVDPGDSLYVSSLITVKKGNREVDCYSRVDVENILNFAEGTFGEEWVSLQSRDAYRGYDDGFENYEQGWKREDRFWLSEDYKKGYLMGWNDAYGQILFKKEV